MKTLKSANNKSRLEQLIALRDKLASAIDDCDSKRDLPALSRQYRDVIKEIEELQKNEASGDTIDQLLSGNMGDDLF